MRHDLDTLKRMRQDGRRPVIVVDFDGTLTMADEWPKVGLLRQSLVTALRMARTAGIAVVLSTCRSGDVLDAAVLECAKAGLDFDAVNENLPELIRAFGGDCRKISGTLLLDDKAWGADVGGFAAVVLALACLWARTQDGME